LELLSGTGAPESKTKAFSSAFRQKVDRKVYTCYYNGIIRKGENMSKAKLTLYVDEKISRLAHKTAKLSGKSISTMIKDFFLEKEKAALSVSPAVAKWIGLLKTKKSYKQLREQHIQSLLRKYESTH
jgi:predicted HicB family RNase H-like nuclease